jgi:GR25 family glycosyltransferase involved in LPS biosynthesis
VQRFIGTTAAEKGGNNCLAFNDSQYRVLKRAIADNCQTATIYEDDVVFDKNWRHINKAVDELPADWWMLYMGGNIFGDDKQNWKMPEKHSPNLMRLYNCWQTHAITYSRKAMNWIVQNFNPNEFPIYDEWLRVNVLNHQPCFMLSPMICYQRPRKSNIWGTHADYTGAHERGNKLFAA